MKKTALKIICLISGIAFAVLAVILVIAIAAAISASAHGSVGIIGGADAPTAQFLFENVVLQSPAFYAATAALAVFLSSGIALLFGKK